MALFECSISALCGCAFVQRHNNDSAIELLIALISRLCHNFLSVGFILVASNYDAPKVQQKKWQSCQTFMDFVK